MARYWVSWYSGYYDSEGCTKPPFQVWISGQRNRVHKEHETEEQLARDDCTICAVIDANSEEVIWPVVLRHFPDMERRFCEEKPGNFQPGNRFPDFREDETLLGGKQ